MEACKISNLYNLDETIAKDLFEGATYPWEVLPKISAFILQLGSTLSKEEYEKIGEDVWIARSATVAPTAYIHGPAIIGKNAEVRHCSVYPRQCDRWGGRSRRQFHRAEERRAL